MNDEPTRPRGKKRPKPTPTDTNADPSLPRWLTVGIVSGFAAFTVVHVLIDIADDSYDGGATSLMLGGIVGAALAGDRINANRNNGGG